MRAPRLVLLFGPAGSGKSTVADGLGRQLPALVLDTDDATTPLFGDDRDSSAYLAARPRLYDALYAVAARNLRLGASVVIDAPHTAALGAVAFRDRIAQMLTETSATLRVLRCQAEPSVVRDRLLRRGAARDVEKLRDWTGYLAGQPDWSDIPFPHVILDTNRPAADVVAEAVRHAGR